MIESLIYLSTLPNVQESSHSRIACAFDSAQAHCQGGSDSGQVAHLPVSTQLYTDGHPGTWAGFEAGSGMVGEYLPSLSVPLLASYAHTASQLTLKTTCTPVLACIEAPLDRNLQVG